MTRTTATRGLLAFFVILLMMPLGHAFVVLMARNLSGNILNIAAAALGFVGIVITAATCRLRSEAMQTVGGAFGAILFWGAWVEFIFIQYAASLHVPPLMDGDTVLTKPEYLMMPTTIPFAVLAFIAYLYFVPSRWGVMVWLRQCLHIEVADHPAQRLHGVKAFVDLLLLIWWAYLILLVEYDPDLLGERHPVTLIFATVCLVAGLILLVRSLSAPTWASALRQAIVTVCVLWTYIEVMIRLKLFTEVWIYPEKYTVEIILMAVAFVVALRLMSYLGHRRGS